MYLFDDRLWDDRGRVHKGKRQHRECLCSNPILSATSRVTESWKVGRSMEGLCSSEFTCRMTKDAARAGYDVWHGQLNNVLQMPEVRLAGRKPLQNT